MSFVVKTFEGTALPITAPAPRLFCTVFLLVKKDCHQDHRYQQIF